MKTQLSNLVVLALFVLNFLIYQTAVAQNNHHDHESDAEPVVAKQVTALKTQHGKASWYGPGFHGRRTASGERYNMYAMTAAHRTLPFGTVVRVTNQKNGKSVDLKINDRGPFKKGRVIDLSKTANTKLACHLCSVKVEVLEYGNGKYRKR